MYSNLTLFLAILCTVLAQQNLYTLSLHPLDRGARCLDGSPAGLYYHEGNGENKNKFMIYFDSGGFCDGATLADTLQSCYKRSFTGLGSTKKSKPQKSFDGQGLLSTKKEENPLFYDWTKIFVIYCDGSQYQGMRQEPISYKDAKLYFRGYNNSMEQFYFMDKHFDFYNGDTIVMTGVSAGGIATYLYSNYLLDNTKKAKVYSIPDSGLFITDYFSPVVQQSLIRLYAENLFKLVSNDGSFPFPECLEDFDGDIVECFNAGNLGKYQRAPMFIVQSAYDEYSLNVIVASQCLTNNEPPYNIQKCNATTREAIQDYRNKTIQALYKIKNGRKNVGLWSPSCVQHGFTDTYSFTDKNFQIPSVGALTVSEAIRQFLDDPQNAKWYLDEVGWPYNSGCNGKAKNIRYE